MPEQPMLEKLIIVDNPQELEIIERRISTEDCTLIFLSNSFSRKNIGNLKCRGYHYYDDFIDEEDANKILFLLNNILTTWFLNEKNKDISIIEGCSFGLVFLSSVQIILNAILKYLFCFKKILKENQEIYIMSNTEEIFLNTIIHLNKKINIKLNILRNIKSTDTATYSSNPALAEGKSRCRNLKPCFRQFSWKRYLALKILKFKSNSVTGNKRILLTNSGKLDTFLRCLSQEKRFSNVQYIIPLGKDVFVDSFSSKNNNLLYYDLINYTNNKSNKVDLIISSLKENINRKIKMLIHPDLLVPALENNIFNYFQNAYSYLLNVVKELGKLKPSLVIISDDSWPTSLLFAGGARKLGIKTAFLNHGIYCSGFLKYTHEYFDYCLSWGAFQDDAFRDRNFKDDSIKRVSFPYYAKFLPFKKATPKKYKNALVLPPDAIDSPFEKLRNQGTFFIDILRLSEKMNFEIIGFKARYWLFFEINGLITNNKYYNYKKKLIPLLSGYTAFPEASKSADFIIGPESSAIIEAGLLNKDYYVYRPASYSGVQFTDTIEKFMHVAKSFSELENNIMLRRTYKEGCSVEDFIDLSGVEHPHDLINKFETCLNKVTN